MSRFRVAALAGLITLAALPAAAQEGARREAERLQGLFQAHLGAGTPDEPTVTVTPEPGFYRVAIYPDRVAKPFESFGVSIESEPFRFSLEPKSAGTWRVFGGEDWSFGYRFQDKSGRLTLSGLKHEGVFDPTIGAFRQSRATIRSSSSESEERGAKDKAESWDHVVEGTTEAAAGDTVRTRAGTTRRDLSQVVTVAWPPGGAAGQSIQIAASAARERQESAIEGVKPKRLLNLWAFLVAHPSLDALTAAQAELKSLAREVMPLFDRISGTSEYEGIAVLTPVGSASASKFLFGVDMTGAVSQGGGGLLIQASDLMVASPHLPDWAKPLVPTVIDLALRGSGLDLEKAAQLALENFDLATVPPISNEVGAEIARAIVPNGNVRVTLPPGRLRAPAYDLRYEGQVDFADLKPAGRVTVSMTGLDKTIAALQAAGGATGTGGALIGLYAAQAMAKTEADGTAVWVIEVVPDGPPLVNGNPVGGAKRP